MSERNGSTEQEASPFFGQVFEHRTVFSRRHFFVRVSDPFVVVPRARGRLRITSGSIKDRWR